MRSSMMQTLPRSLFALAVAAALLVAAMPAATAQSIGSPMPAAGQQLPNATGAATSLSALQGSNATVVVFWSNQCPWTDRYEDRLRGLVREYEGRGVQFVLINSNSASDFPRESLAASRKEASGFGVPYLKDEGGQVADAFGAARTPHVFVYDGQGQLAYTGAIDDSPGDPSSVGQAHLGNAISALAAGNAPATRTTSAFGCKLKK